MKPGSHLHTILDPNKVPRKSEPTFFVIQEGFCHIDEGTSVLIIPILKIGELDSSIVISNVNVGGLEINEILKAVAGPARVESKGPGKLAYVAFGFKP
jgi:hypothetical protein